MCVYVCVCVCVCLWWTTTPSSVGVQSHGQYDYFLVFTICIYCISFFHSQHTICIAKQGKRNKRALVRPSHHRTMCVWRSSTHKHTKNIWLTHEKGRAMASREWKVTHTDKHWNVRRTSCGIRRSWIFHTGWTTETEMRCEWSTTICYTHTHRKKHLTKDTWDLTAGWLVGVRWNMSNTHTNAVHTHRNEKMHFFRTRKRDPNTQTYTHMFISRRSYNTGNNRAVLPPLSVWIVIETY